MKTVQLFVLFVLIFSVNASAQKKDSTESPEDSFMDKVAKVIEVRKGFDVKSETSKPAIFSYKKVEDDDAIFTVDAAVMYMLFSWKDFAVYPAVQFDYVSHGKKKAEKLMGMLIGEYILYNTPYATGKLEPSVSYSKDFFTDERVFKSQLIFQPSFPNFVIPIRNVSDVHFKYNGKDDRWVFGINPMIGIAYEDDLEKKTKDDVNSLYTVTKGSASIKRYYMTFTVYGDYQAQFEDDKKSFYKYGAILTIYLDAKERASINGKFEHEDKKTKDNELSFGFGLKL
jgi:hypothetical protein